MKKNTLCCVLLAFSLLAIVSCGNDVDTRHSEFPFEKVAEALSTNFDVDKAIGYIKSGDMKGHQDLLKENDAKARRKMKYATSLLDSIINVEIPTEVKDLGININMPVTIVDRKVYSEGEEYQKPRPTFKLSIVCDNSKKGQEISEEVLKNISAVACNDETPLFYCGNPYVKKIVHFGSKDNVLFNNGTKILLMFQYSFDLYDAEDLAKVNKFYILPYDHEMRKIAKERGEERKNREMREFKKRVGGE